MLEETLYPISASARGGNCSDFRFQQAPGGSAPGISPLPKMFKLVRDKGGASQKAKLSVVEKQAEYGSLGGMKLEIRA